MNTEVLHVHDEVIVRVDELVLEDEEIDEVVLREHMLSEPFCTALKEYRK